MSPCVAVDRKCGERVGHVDKRDVGDVVEVPPGSK